MTYEEFKKIQCGDRIKNIATGEIGEVKVASRGEYYVEYPSHPGQLIMYDESEYYSEDGNIWDFIELVKG